MQTYELELCGLKRNLPIIKLSDELSIASFVILGDTELIVTCAPYLVKQLPEVDVIVTAEAKGIPLAFEISKLLNKKEYIVARKSIKPYMNNPVTDEVTSITTQQSQLLCLEEQDIKKIKGKRVAIIDDVISTGESLAAIERLITKVGGNVVAKAALLAEGNAKNRKDIIFLKHLPLFS